MVQVERQAKKAEFKNKDTGIRVATTLWCLDEGKKMTQVL
jgi:hypothetical protein